jgi:DNA mismatch repair protein MutS2
VEPLKALTLKGYKAPIGDLPPLGATFRAAAVGQILDGASLRAVGDLLESTRRVNAFASDFAPTVSTLRRVKARLLPMPQLLNAINRAVGPTGELRDDASPELTRIRKARVGVRRRIEETIGQLFRGSELEKYLQDDFFTVRNDRYVVPMKLDGRGRIKGQVLDASASGQTLYIEPTQIAPINDQLLELEVEEKLEIARIFRELSAQVEAELSTLRGDYDELVYLDGMMAEAHFAAETESGPVKLVDQPSLDLRDARHPLIKRTQGKSPVANAVQLTGRQTVLIISGPNAGGKTVVLKTVGLIALMARAGLLVPADPKSELFPFERLFLELGDAQSLTASLSTFSGHLTGLKPVLERAGPKDLALLDELAVGTDPQTGAAIGTAILEELATRQTTTLVTTHFDALKGLAIADQRFRNGSMEFSLGTLKPTYKLILDVPGQSYGLEVAEQIGLPARVLKRAKELRSATTSDLDRAVGELMRAREAAQTAEKELAAAKLEAESAKARWEQEVELLNEQRRKAKEQLADKYGSQVQDLRTQFDDLVKRLRQSMKDAQSGGEAQGREAVLDDRRAAEKTLRDMEQVIGQLNQGSDPADKLPGQPASRTAIEAGTPVYVLPLKKAGRVLRLAPEGDTVEVEVGILKLRVSTHDLRILSEGEAPASASQSGGGKKGGGAAGGSSRSGSRGRQGTQAEIAFVLPSSLNSLDLRGKNADEAVEAMWNFVDRSMLRGEDAVVIIHGHGEGTLKAKIRSALKTASPYELLYRPGMEQEGGDGVTVLRLRT